MKRSKTNQSKAWHKIFVLRPPGGILWVSREKKMLTPFPESRCKQGWIGGNIQLFRQHFDTFPKEPKRYQQKGNPKKAASSQSSIREGTELE